MQQVFNMQITLFRVFVHMDNWLFIPDLHKEAIKSPHFTTIPASVHMAGTVLGFKWLCCAQVLINQWSLITDKDVKYIWQKQQLADWQKINPQQLLIINRLFKYFRQKWPKFKNIV